MPLTAGFCPFAVGADDTYALGDARSDPATAANPAVEQLGVVAYAGVPLRAAGGEPVGTLCAIDYEPREWSETDLGLLAELGAGAIAELQLLAATRRLAWHHAGLEALTALARSDDVDGAVNAARERVRVGDELTGDERAYLAAVDAIAALGRRSS
jgi:GAF domain-containing protein